MATVSSMKSRTLYRNKIVIHINAANQLTMTEQSFCLIVLLRQKTPGKAIECDDKSVTVTNPDDAMTGTCEKLKLNEIGSYMEPEEQFIEVVNSGNEPINLSNCYIAKSKANNAVHAQMDDYEIEPGGLYAFNVDQTDLEYIAKTSGIIYLIDSDDETVVNYKRYSGVKEGAITAIDNNGEWQMTYQMTPGEDNVIEEYPPCPDGNIAMRQPIDVAISQKTTPTRTTQTATTLMPTASWTTMA